MTIYYDDALPGFAAIVKRRLGDLALIENVFLRDATGRITFVATESSAQVARNEIASEAARLFPYVESQQEATATPAELFDESLADSNCGTIDYISHPQFTGFVRVVERRIVGADWLVPPQSPIPTLPPIIVFASHKGGVGRSTALAVTAADLAASNLNVLTVDLDLEAPGIGGMLLESREKPEFGSVDFFVENGLQPLGPNFLNGLTGVSRLTVGRGIVHVVPANGQRSDKSPQNVLGKLARVYLEDPAPINGRPKSFLGQTRDLMAAVASQERYDAILIDVRAGLNESTAAAILGLGADVLLFGINTPQTFEGYRYLLSHLASFKSESDEDDWRFRLKMVQAKSTTNPDAMRAFRNSSFELFAETLYDEDEKGEAFNFNIDDPSAPHFPLPILNDANYLEFDPLAHPEQLGSTFYNRTFGDFLTGIRDRIGLKKTENADR